MRSILILFFIFVLNCAGQLGPKVRTFDDKIQYNTNRLSIVGDTYITRILATNMYIREYNVVDLSVGDRIYMQSNGYIIVTNDTVVGKYANHSGVGTNVTVFGYYAGYTNKGDRVSLFGHYAGWKNIGNDVSAIGYYAAGENTKNNVIAIGYEAAEYNTGVDTIALGHSAAQNNSGGNVIAMGYQAAQNNSATDVIAIGYKAASDNTGIDIIALGNTAAQYNKGDDVIAVGNLSSRNNIDDRVISIGANANVSGTNVEDTIFIGNYSGALASNVIKSVGVGGDTFRYSYNIIECVAVGYGAMSTFDTYNLANVNAFGVNAANRANSVSNISVFSGYDNLHYFISGATEDGYGYWGISTNAHTNIIDARYLYFCDRDGDGREERYSGDYKTKPSESTIILNGLVLVNITGNFVVEDTGTTNLHFQIQFSTNQDFSVTNFSATSSVSQVGFKYLDLTTYSISNFPSYGMPLKDQNAAESLVLYEYTNAIMGEMYYVRASNATNPPDWSTPIWKFNRILVAE